MKPPEIIKTDRLTLRRIVENDSEGIFRTYASDPQVTKYVSHKTSFRIEDTRLFVKGLEKAWDARTFYSWSIFIEDNQLIGGISLQLTDWKAEVGFVIGHNFWDQGYCTEALSCIVKWTDKQTNINRLWAICDVDNIGSCRVLEKCGFESEGILRNWVIHPQISNFPRDCYSYSKVKRITS